MGPGREPGSAVTLVSIGSRLRGVLLSSRAATELPVESVLVSEAVEFCSKLIQIDTMNHAGAGANESVAADFVLQKLRQVGLSPVLFEPAPGRCTVVCRITGEEALSDLPGLVVHAHLDTVPANEADWTIPPLSGEVRDGRIWGRGAIDMKNACAIMLALARHIARTGEQPGRDVVLVWFADEETGGEWGARALLKERPDLVAGCDTAVGEVGGFSVQLTDGRRAYLVETEQKGVVWARLRAEGDAGHGSLCHSDPAPQRLTEALTRILNASWPGQEPADSLALTDLASEPSIARWVEAARQNTCNVTQLSASGASNVVPGTATADLDCRILATPTDGIITRLRSLAGKGIVVNVLLEEGFSASPLDPEFARVALECVSDLDPEAVLQPFRMPIGSDNQAFRLAGFKAYGFLPMRLPAGFDLPSMFHGIDECIPIESLAFGAEALHTLVLSY